MKKSIFNILICSIATVLFSGVAVGLYFLVPSVKINSQDENLTNAQKMYKEEGVKNEEQFTDFDEKTDKTIKYAAKLTLTDDSYVFYYELENYTAGFDVMDFAVSIKESKVMKFMYLGFVSGHGEVGDPYVSSTSGLFINYTTGDESWKSSFSGMTDTYNSMSKAIDIAISDSSRR